MLTPFRLLCCFLCGFALAVAAPSVAARRADTSETTPAPERVLQRGHSGTVNAVAFCALRDRPLAVSASDDGTVRLWDIRCRLLARVLSGDGTPLTCLATFAAANGDPIIAAGGGRAIILWNGRTGAVVRRLTLPLSETYGAVRSVAVSLDGSLLAAASDQHEDIVLEGKPAPRLNVGVWDLHTGQRLAAWLAHPHGVNALLFSRDGKTLWTAGGERIAIARYAKETAPLSGWEPRTGRLSRSLAGGADAVLALALSPGGETLAAGGADRTIRLWDMRTAGAVVRPFATAPVKYAVGALAWTRGGTRLVSTTDGGQHGSDDESDQWDVAAGKITKVRDGEPPAQYGRAIAASPTGAYLLSGDGKAVCVFDGNRKAVTFPGVETLAQALALSSDGRYAATLSATTAPRAIRESRPTQSPRRAVDIWDTANGSLNSIVTTPSLNLSEPSLRVVCFRFAPREPLLAIGEEKITRSDLAKAEGVISLVDPATGKRLVSLPAAPQAPNAIAWSPDGKTLVSGGGEGIFGKAPYFLYWWDRATATRTRTVPRNRPAAALAVSPDGKTLAVGDRVGQKVWLYDMATGRNTGFLPAIDAGGSVRSLAFSPDGTFLAWGGYTRSEFPLSNVATGRTLLVWKVALGEKQTPRLLEPASKEEVNTVAWSPNGRYLFAGDEAGQVTTWDAATGSRVNRWRAETESQGVAALTVSPDGSRLYTADFAGGLSFWGVSSNAAQPPRPVITLFSVGSDGYLMINPQNYYRAARQSAGVVAFRQDGLIYPFDTFDAVYNRPDKILESVGGGDPARIAAFRKAHEKRLARQGAKAAPLANVHVRAGALPLYTGKPTLTFPVSVSGRGTTRVRVRVNTVPVPDVLLAAGAGTVSVDLSSDTGHSTGLNRIDLAAIGADGAESLPETTYLFYDGDDPSKRDYLGANHLMYTYTPEPHDLYLLTVGVTAYDDTAYNLRYAAADASALGDFLEQARGSFPHVHRETLTDAGATKESIIAAARRLLAGAKPNDTVIVFLAGHGLLAPNGDYFFGTRNIVFAHPQTGGLSYTAIEHLFDGCAARNRLLLMDTCHAGEVDPAQFAGKVAPGAAVTPTGLPGKAARGMAGQVPPAERGENTEQQAFALMQEAFADLRRGSGTQVVAASGGTEFAWEEKGHGVFTAALLEGLYGLKADANGDGVISVTELRDYVSARVSALTHGQQKPVARSENAEFDFVVF